MRTRPAITLLVAFALVVRVGAAWAQGVLPTAKPEEVGFSAERLDRVTEMLRANVEKREIPGAVLLVARHGKVAYFESVGFLDPQSRTAMTRDAIFRIYSMSKAITSVAAMTLFEEGRFILDEPVAKYLPQFEKLKVAPTIDQARRSIRKRWRSSQQTDRCRSRISFATHPA